PPRPGLPEGGLLRQFFSACVIGGIGQFGILGEWWNQRPLAHGKFTPLIARTNKRPHAPGMHLWPPEPWWVLASHMPVAFNSRLIGCYVAIAHREILACLLRVCNVGIAVLCRWFTVGEHVRAAFAASAVQFPGCAWDPVRRRCQPCSRSGWDI